MRKLIFASLLLATLGTSYAMKHYLIAEWYERGDHMCKYDNGTVLNMGYKICPLSIEDPK